MRYRKPLIARSTEDFEAAPRKMAAAAIQRIQLITYVSEKNLKRDPGPVGSPSTLWGATCGESANIEFSFALRVKNPGARCFWWRRLLRFYREERRVDRGIDDRLCEANDGAGTWVAGRTMDLLLKFDSIDCFVRIERHRDHLISFLVHHGLRSPPL